VRGRERRLILTAIIAAAVWAGSRYLQPFGRCHKCKGTGRIRRGKRRVKVCPRCKGHRRVQRRGSGTLHRAVFKIRDGRQAVTRYQEGKTTMCDGRTPSSKEK
jgi:DnaJ-class molecular chaperone